jgi:hypothetical protein
VAASSFGIVTATEALTDLGVAFSLERVKPCTAN